MSRQSISLTTPDPTVSVNRVGGSLQAEGWDKQELEATGEDLVLGREDQAITLSCAGDLALKVPKRTILGIDFVGRNLELHGLDGPVDISFVGSDAELRDLTSQVTFRGLVGGGTRMENVSKVATNHDGPGPFRAGSEGPWRNAERMRERVDEQRRKFEKKMQHAERKLERMRAGIGSDSARWRWHGLFRADQPAEQAQPVSEEERLTILRMLQEKKITPEEADKLLAALEGES